jgi:transcriptional regulator with XRE-family HTH domain
VTPESFRKAVGLNIRKYRQLARLNQSDLATLLKTSQPNVSEWENGAAMELDTIYKIAKALKIKPHVLLDINRV